MWDMTINSNSKLTKAVCQAICFLVFIKRSPFFKTKMMTATAGWEEGVERTSLLVAAPYNFYTANSCSDFPCICFTNALFVSQPLLSDGCVYII